MSQMLFERFNNKQDVFDYVVRKLYEQAAFSVDKNGDCRYRSPNGNRCAIGYLVPNSVYSFSMENLDADMLYHLIANDSIVIAKVYRQRFMDFLEKYNNDGFLQKMQEELHDVFYAKFSNSITKEAFRREFMIRVKKFAKENKLKVPKITAN